jgi:hypothetical protein
VFTLFPRTRRRTAALRPTRARLSVERLEGRDAPSSLDVTSLTSPLTDSTATSATTAISPAPSADTNTPVVPVAVVPAPVTPPPQTTGVQAGDTLPAPSTPPVGPALDESNIAVKDNGGWNYTVTGTVTDSNPGAPTVKITVDSTNEPDATMTPVANPDGTPSGTWSFSSTFGLPACTSATNSTRFGTAVATDGTNSSSVAVFLFTQNPNTPATVGKT